MDVGVRYPASGPPPGLRRSARVPRKGRKARCSILIFKLSGTMKNEPQQLPSHHLGTLDTFGRAWSVLGGHFDPNHQGLTVDRCSFRVITAQEPPSVASVVQFPDGRKDC